MKKRKVGVAWKDAQKLGYNQVMGMPGVAYSRKDGRLFNAQLVEVGQNGEPIEPVIIEPAPAETVAGAPAIDTVEAAGAADTIAGAGDDTVAGAEGGDAQPADVPSDSPAIAAAREKVAAAQAALDDWTSKNDATTKDGKKEYARLYGAVRRAKDAVMKAGGKID